MTETDKGFLARTKLGVLGLLALLGVLGMVFIARVANNLPPAFAARTVSVDPPSGNAAQAWQEVDALINAQKFQEALDKTDRILEEARASKDEAQWTRALVKSVQLQVGLHGYETAVRFLKEQPWPADTLYQDVLSLFYARCLVTYFQVYSWEINQREKVASTQKVDLKAWTRDEIFAEACRAFDDVMKDKEFIGLIATAGVKEYVAPSTYPAGIRDTLRDTVTYLYADLLGDSNFWTPAQSNEIYRLDLASLMREGPRAVPQEEGKANEGHPLARRCALLADLEAWHKGRGETEAALEARLELLRRLHGAFAGEEDRALIVRQVEKDLEGLQGLPWWSWGMADLATFVRQESDPDGQIRAKDIAQKGYEAHQAAPGGTKCLSILKSIEAPEFRIQAMQTDAPAKRSVEVTHRNLPAIYFRAYRMDLFKIIETHKDYNLLPDWDEVRKIVEGRKPDAEWAMDLPPTPDYRLHKTFATTPDLAPGAYVLAASAKQGFPRSKNAIQALEVVVSNLVLLRSTGPESESVVTVLHGGDGTPAPGVQVHLYGYDYQKGHQKLDSQTTGEDGTVRFPASKTPPGRNTFVLAQKGDDIALDSTYFYSDYQRREGAVSACLVFTDRSIYRPLQKILWKVVTYSGSRETGQFKTMPSCDITVTLFDHSHQKVESQNTSANSFGTASGEFTIPSGRLLGNWSIEASPQGSASVRVEEYKRPTFEAAFKDPAEPMRLNKPAALKGEARYYFGLPVTSGQVKWKVTREAVYPWWWDWFWGEARASAQIVASGASEVRDDGSFEVPFTPAADEREAKRSREVTYRFTVSAEVTDEGGETRTASRTVRLGFVSVEATIASKAGFFTEGKPAQATITRTDLDGNPRPGKGEWRLVALKQPERTLLPAETPIPAKEATPGEKPPYSTPGDFMHARWEDAGSAETITASWSEGAVLSRGQLEHGEDGKAEVELPPQGPGVYRLRYETTDDFGAKCENFKDLVVASAKTPLNLPLVLFAESTSVTVGDPIRLFAHSGVAGQQLHLEIYKDGRLQESRTLTSGQDAEVIDIPVRESDRGGLGVRLWAVRDDQYLHSEQSVFVPWDDKELKVEFATFRDKLRPGARETWRVTVREPGGGAGAAEVLAYMYDKSLDLFAPHFAPAVSSIYPARGRAGSLRPNLASVWPQFVQDYGLAEVPVPPYFTEATLRFYDSYGIGGPGVVGGFGGGVLGGIAAPQEQRLRAANAPAVQADFATGKEENAKDTSYAFSKVAPARGAVGLKGEAAATTSESTTPPPEAPQELRSNFAETAFWLPHLLTSKDGSAIIEFTAPDSVTAWNVWVHAVTQDLKGGSLKKEARSVKELMVRPYVPRFLREGDKAELKIVVNNASQGPLDGTVKLEIFDPETNEDLLPAFGLKGSSASAPFTVKAGGGANVSFPVAAPRKLGLAAFKVTAKTGNFSDGELRPVPLLPSRVHLAQSRFAALHDAEKRDLVFADMAKGGDPTRVDEMLVVTVDAQLFYSVLSALPYLVNYPYECDEQIMNRYLSTGILASLYKDYPAVARMAQEFSKRDTVLETWDDVDPNRKIAIEETPWVVEAKGGTDCGYGMAKVLDPRIAQAEKESSLRKLRKAQTALGAFPWWPGGPPSPWMTLYILYGFSKGLEFGVDAPKDVTVRAWAYMHRHYVDEVVRTMMAEDCCWEFVTFLNYVLSNYPDASWTGGVFTDAERKRMLDFSFRHWKDHSPYSKCQLALTLKRMGREPDAKLVFDSVMDSAKTTRDEGTFWAPEDRGWLWYNDTIETHAFALRTMMELAPRDDRAAGMVQWLFLNKKLNHWKSTKATAEVIYTLAHYLKRTGELGIREDASVIVGGQRTDFVFEPDAYTGKKCQVVVPGAKIDPRSMSDVVVRKESKGLAFASATWHFSTDELPEEGSGDFFSVHRAYFKRETSGDQVTLKPLADGTELRVGDQVEVQISLKAKHAAEYVHLRDPRAAGMEPEDLRSCYKYDLGIARYEETRDSGTNFFMEQLPAGEYTLKYRVRVNMAGVFRVGPATVQSMYAPEFNAYSSGTVVAVKP